MNSSNVLILGGAGYIGLVIADRLLKEGYNVTVADNLIYQNEFALRSYLLNEKFSFENYDHTTTTVKDLKCIPKTDYVIVLSGLVGDPITKKYPNYSSRVNGLDLRNIFQDLNDCNVKKVIFTSTCSNYGMIPEDQTASENHPLNPLSLYAEEKVNAEKFIIKNCDSFNYQSIILRFSTAFGCAPRMRFDLSVNEFVKDIFDGKTLDVYDADTWRPYCHVRDFAEIINLCIGTEKEYFGEVFNAGSDENNATKRMIIENILKYIPDGIVKYVDGGFDRRNYKVNFEKAKNDLGFNPTWNIDKGIEELITNLRKGIYVQKNNSENFFGNYHLEGKD